VPEAGRYWRSLQARRKVQAILPKTSCHFAAFRLATILGTKRRSPRLQATCRSRTISRRYSVGRDFCAVTRIAVQHLVVPIAVRGVTTPGVCVLWLGGARAKPKRRSPQHYRQHYRDHVFERRHVRLTGGQRGGSMQRTVKSRCGSLAFRQGSGPGRVMWRAPDRELPPTFPSEETPRH